MRDHDREAGKRLGLHGLGATLLALTLTGLASGVQAREYPVEIDARSEVPSGTPITFGMVFESGDIPYDAPLTARVLVDGKAYGTEVQIDRKASHCEDAGSEFTTHESCGARSLRHAVVSVALPMTLPRAKRATVVLSQDGGSLESTGPSAGFPDDLDLQTRLSLDGETWIADLSDVAASLAGTAPPAGTVGAEVVQWLQGPLATERILRVPFVSESGGRVHSELTAVYGVRHHPLDGSTRLEVVVENVDIEGSDMRSYEYDVDVLVDGVSRYSERLIHFPHSRWRIPFWREPRPDFHLSHDPAQLMATYAVPNYDSQLIHSLDDRLTNNYATFWADNAPVVVTERVSFPGEDVKCYQTEAGLKKADCDAAGAYRLAVNTVGPMGVGGIPNWYMPATGGRQEIGPLPTWTASYLLEQSYATKQTMLAIGDSSGSWPVHLRDPATGLPVAVADMPNVKFGDSSRSGTPTLFTCDRAVTCKKPFVADNAHQTSFVYVPYLVTGEHYYLEEMHFWASFNSMSIEPTWRGMGKGILERSTQARGAAWALRNLGHAAWATPDDYSLKDDVLQVLRHNIDEWIEIYVADPTRTNSFGAIVTGQFPITSPWMDDYFTWSVGNLVDLGFLSAEPLARWKGQFSVQRLSEGMSSESDFCWVFAAQYHLLIAPTDTIPASTNGSITTVGIKRGPNTVPGTSTMFKNIDSVYQYTNKATNGGYEIPRGGGMDNGEACGTSAQFAAEGLAEGEMVGTAKNPRYFLAQMGPALSVAVDRGTNGAEAAWARYNSRVLKPDFSADPTWAILPRSLGTSPAEENFTSTVSGGECRVRPG